MALLHIQINETLKAMAKCNGKLTLDIEFVTKRRKSDDNDGGDVDGDDLMSKIRRSRKDVWQLAKRKIVFVGRLGSERSILCGHVFRHKRTS